jgi:hypothetical protein
VLSHVELERYQREGLLPRTPFGSDLGAAC